VRECGIRAFVHELHEGSLFEVITSILQDGIQLRRGPTGDKSPVYMTAPDQSGYPDLSDAAV
jgi:hypothetical protein